MKDTLPEKVQEAIVNKLLARGANSRCSDCHAKGPCWISMDFGVFICLNCSGQHRNLGPHITRVRSIKLDKWTTEMAQLMDGLGNDIAEAYYEAKMTSNFGRPDPNGGTPDRTKQFIIKKYVEKVWAREGPTPFQIYSKGGKPAEVLQAGAPAPVKGPAPEAPKPLAEHIDLLDIGSAPVITEHQGRAPTQDLLSFDNVDTTGGRRKSRPSNSTGHSLEQQQEEAKSHQHQLNHHPVPVVTPKNDAFNFIKPKESTTSTANPTTATAMKQVYQMPMFDLTAQPAKQQIAENPPNLAHFNSNPLPGQLSTKPVGNIMDLYNNVEIKEPAQPAGPGPADPKKGTLQRGNYAFLESMGGARPPQPPQQQNGFNPMGQRPPAHPGTQMPNGFVPGLSVNRQYGAGHQ